MMRKDARIWVAGSNGMVGSAIVRRLHATGFGQIITSNSSELDIRNSEAVRVFFEKNKPEFVFMAAAKVGGIVANNTYRAEFLYDNLMMEANVIHQSYLHRVEKLLFLGSSCIYPKLAEQPLKEEALLSGFLEPTNEPYAIAKIAGIKLCENYRKQYGCDFISAMPTNLYGPNDNYHQTNSHVIPALIRKFLEAKRSHAKEVEVWGSGTPMREFMHVNDLAEACLFLMSNYSSNQFINVGTGIELTIRELAQLISKLVGFDGEIRFNAEMPDGTPRKMMDVSRIHAMGWRHQIDLEVGLKEVIDAESLILR